MRPENRRFKTAIYEQFARIGKALANPVRLELLDLLGQGERTVEVLAEAAGISVATASHHLQALRSARLVDAEKRGLFVTYRMADPAVCELLDAFRGVAETRLAEVEQITRAFFKGRDGFEPVDSDTLLHRIQEGAVTVLDVRPPEEYRAAHIPGAVSVPLSELKRRLPELPRDREVVAYCRGPYCVLAAEAVEMLRAEGFRAIRLPEGVLDWRARGLDVARGAEEVGT